MGICRERGNGRGSHLKKKKIAPRAVSKHVGPVIGARKKRGKKVQTGKKLGEEPCQQPSPGGLPL